MRDISVSKIDLYGYSSFALANIQPVSGIKLLAAKITKKILSSSFSTSLFQYYGLDLDQLAYTNISDSTVNSIKVLISSKLKNIESSIQDNTLSSAPSEERLSSLSLEDIVYDNTSYKLYLKIKIYPVKGDAQSLIFPLDK